jgi:hypothetical protein
VTEWVGHESRLLLGEIFVFFDQVSKILRVALAPETSISLYAIRLVLTS